MTFVTSFFLFFFINSTAKGSAHLYLCNQYPVESNINQYQTRNHGPELLRKAYRNKITMLNICKACKQNNCSE